MKRKRLMITIIQLLLVGTFGFSLISYTQKEVSPTTVWKFKSDMPVNQEISLADLEKVTIPSKAVDEHYIKDENEIVGKYTSVKISKDQKVIDDLIYDKGSLDPFKGMDTSDLRKISLPISNVDTISGNIKRGEKVDLVFTGKGEKDGTNGQFNYSKVFLQGVYVWSVNTDDGYQAEDHSLIKKGEVQTGDDTEKIDTSSNSDEATTITLAVTYEQAEEIAARLETGTIRVIGRFDDSEDYNSTGYVVGDYQKVFSGNANAETSPLTNN